MIFRQIPYTDASFPVGLSKIIDNQPLVRIDAEFGRLEIDLQRRVELDLN